MNTRHSLIENHRDYAQALAAEILRSISRQVDRDDVFAAAALGLVEAAESFDVSKGVSFKTFAHARIRGAVYDFLRKNGVMSRDEYRKHKAAVAANELERDLSSRDVPADVVSQLNELREHVGAVVLTCVLSLDGLQVDAASRYVQADTDLEVDQMRSLIRDLAGQVSERSRFVLQKYFYEDVTLEEIGAAMGLSKSWTSRLLKQALLDLRELLQERGIGGEVLRAFDVAHNATNWASRR